MVVGGGPMLLRKSPPKSKHLLLANRLRPAGVIFPMAMMKRCFRTCEIPVVSCPYHTGMDGACVPEGTYCTHPSVDSNRAEKCRQRVLPLPHAERKGVDAEICCTDHLQAIARIHAQQPSSARYIKYVHAYAFAFAGVVSAPLSAYDLFSFPFLSFPFLSLSFLFFLRRSHHSQSSSGGAREAVADSSGCGDRPSHASFPGPSPYPGRPVVSSW